MHKIILCLLMLASLFGNSKGGEISKGISTDRSLDLFPEYNENHLQQLLTGISPFNSTSFYEYKKGFLIKLDLNITNIQITKVVFDKSKIESINHTTTFPEKKLHFSSEYIGTMLNLRTNFDYSLYFMGFFLYGGPCQAIVKSSGINLTTEIGLGDFKDENYSSVANFEFNTPHLSCRDFGKIYHSRVQYYFEKAMGTEWNNIALQPQQQIILRADFMDQVPGDFSELVIGPFYKGSLYVNSKIIQTNYSQGQNSLILISNCSTEYMSPQIQQAPLQKMNSESIGINFVMTAELLIDIVKQMSVKRVLDVSLDSSEVNQNLTIGWLSDYFPILIDQYPLDVELELNCITTFESSTGEFENELISIDFLGQCEYRYYWPNFDEVVGMNISFTVVASISITERNKLQAIVESVHLKDIYDVTLPFGDNVQLEFYQTTKEFINLFYQNYNLYYQSFDLTYNIPEGLNLKLTEFSPQYVTFYYE